MSSADEARLPTHIWVEAELRRLSDCGIGVYVSKRGDRMGGMVLQKITDMAGHCRLLGLQRNASGTLGWANVMAEEIVAEGEADAAIARAAGRDPDVWVVEIEDKAMVTILGSAMFPLITD